MGLLNNLSVGRKLTGLSAVGLLAAGIIGTVAYVDVHQIKDQSAAADAMTTVSAEFGRLDKMIIQVQVAQRDQLLATDDAARKAALDDLTAVTRSAEEVWDRISELGVPAEVAARLDGVHGTYTTYLSEAAAQMPILAPIDPSSPAARVALTRERDRGNVVGDLLAATRNDLGEQVGAARAATDSKIEDVRRTVLIVGACALIVLLGTALLVTRSIVRPLAKIVEVLNAVSRRELNVPIDVHGKDEVGQMADALRTALAAIRGVIAAIAAIAGNATTLAAASEELTAVSTELGGNAERTSTQAGQVSTTADEVSGRVQAMSAATEEMTVAIAEIAGSAANAATVATTAVTTAGQTSAAVAELGQASAEISEILKLITGIAGQTNLLALNATIEAARAGDAGKGFAVVASEVKDLAQETANATDSITAKINAIQQTTAQATSAIGQITTVVNEISSIQNTIAAAVEEQTATEISRNVGEIAEGARHIAENITGVASSATSTSEGAVSTRQSAADLSRMAAEADQLAAGFTH